MNDIRGSLCETDRMEFKLPPDGYVCIGPCDKIDTSLYFTGIYTLLDCSNIHYVSIYHLPSVLLPYTIPFKILG